MHQPTGNLPCAPQSQQIACEYCELTFLPAEDDVAAFLEAGDFKVLHEHLRAAVDRGLPAPDEAAAA